MISPGLTKISINVLLTATVFVIVVQNKFPLNMKEIWKVNTIGTLQHV